METSNEEEKVVDVNAPKCTEGSEDKCAKAQSETCRCACNGENHGKDKKV